MQMTGGVFEVPLSHRNLGSPIGEVASNVSDADFAVPRPMMELNSSQKENNQQQFSLQERGAARETRGGEPANGAKLICSGKDHPAVWGSTRSRTS